MKRLLIFLLCLVPFVGGAQSLSRTFIGSPSGMEYNTRIGGYSVTKWMKVPRVLLTLPAYDSAGGGQIAFDSANTRTMWYHNGTQWVQFGSGGGGSGTVTSITAGYGLNGGTITTSGTVLVDTTRIVNRRMLDSVANEIPTTNDYVPYTGATGALNMGNYSVTAPKVLSDTLQAYGLLMGLHLHSTSGTGIVIGEGGANTIKFDEYPTAVAGDSVLSTTSDGTVVQYNLKSKLSNYALQTALNDTASAIRGAIPSTSGFVPYTGAIDSVRLGEYQIRAGQVALDLTPTAPTVVGGMYWDATNVCPAMPFDATYTHRFGQAIVERARNNTGTTISAGKAVYISGAQGNNPTITMANPDSVNSSRVIGITVESIADNATGFVMVTGKLDGINTSGFTVGTALYLDTITGGLTQALLPPPHNVVYIGQALNSTNNGRVFIRPAQALGSDTTLGNASQQIAPTQEAVKKYVTNNRTTVSAGTGISVTGSVPTYTITNTAPDQTVALNSGTGISVSGSYPTFTVTNTSPSSGGTVTSIQVVGGTGATVTPTTAVTTSGAYTVTPEVSSATYNTLTNKRWVPRVISAASYTTSVTIPADSVDLFQITAQAGALLFNAPSGTPNNGDLLVIRIKDNGTARALTYNAIFNWSPPSTTVLGKYLVMCFMYNSVTSNWNFMWKRDEP